MDANFGNPYPPPPVTLRLSRHILATASRGERDIKEYII